MLMLCFDQTRIVIRDSTGAQPDRELPLSKLLTWIGAEGILTQESSPSDIGAAPAEAAKAAIGITIDGAGSPISTGLKGLLVLSYDCTITGWSIVADQAGSCALDVWRKSGAVPTDADSITASAPPTLSAAQLVRSATLTGWTVELAAGDVLAFNVDSAATCTRITLQLEIEKS